MSIRIFAKKKNKDQTVLKKKNSAVPIAEPQSMNQIPNVNIAVQDYKKPSGRGRLTCVKEVTLSNQKLAKNIRPYGFEIINPPFYSRERS